MGNNKKYIYYIYGILFTCVRSTLPESRIARVGIFSSMFERTLVRDVFHWIRVVEASNLLVFSHL